MKCSFIIRRLVEQALYTGMLTSDMEKCINAELTRLGYLNDADSEALELLMYEIDAGRIHLASGV